jgi:hypothetical protein
MQLNLQRRPKKFLAEVYKMNQFPRLKSDFRTNLIEHIKFYESIQSGPRTRSHKRMNK